MIFLILLPLGTVDTNGLTNIILILPVCPMPVLYVSERMGIMLVVALFYF